MQTIHLPIFLLSFLFGLFAVWMHSNDKRIIVVYPTPENVDSIQYKDLAGHCFIYKQTPIDCKVAKNIKTVKPQK